MAEIVGRPEPQHDSYCNHRDPLVPLDLAVFDNAGDPLPVWPCGHCDPWHLEVVRDGQGEVWAREWHAPDCPHLADLLKED